MKCTNCGIEMVDIASESMTFTSKLVGAVIIPNVPKKTCRNSDCDMTFISSETTKMISLRIAKIEHGVIDTLPIGDFISCQDAAEILGISKQAFSKKIKTYRKLFVIKMIDGKDLLYRPSIAKYASDNDGRVLLCNIYNEQKFVD